MAKAKKKAKAKDKAKGKGKGKKELLRLPPAAVKITSPADAVTIPNTGFPFVIPNVAGFFRTVKALNIRVRIATEANDTEVDLQGVIAVGSTWTTTITVNAADDYVIDAYDSSIPAGSPQVGDAITITVS